MIKESHVRDACDEGVSVHWMECDGMNASIVSLHYVRFWNESTMSMVICRKTDAELLFSHPIEQPYHSSWQYRPFYLEYEVKFEE